MCIQHSRSEPNADKVGNGIGNPEYFADVIYGWSLIHLLSFLRLVRRRGGQSRRLRELLGLQLRLPGQEVKLPTLKTCPVELGEGLDGVLGSN